MLSAGMSFLSTCDVIFHLRSLTSQIISMIRTYYLDVRMCWVLVHKPRGPISERPLTPLIFTNGS